MDNEFYKHVESQLSEKGKHKLANAVAHGNELESISAMVKIKRKNDFIFITVEGEIYKAVKCI